jgi:5-(carboxyamino)imidazole ribonucleotide synthase
MTAILPGATIGVLGSGQLGRMFAIAARRLGYRVRTFSPDYDTPTGQVADVEVTASYDDLEAVAAFARKVKVITFEFENVPAAAAEVCSQYCPVRPAHSVLHTTQQRLREKTFLSSHGFPVAPFQPVRSVEDLREAVARLGLPAILKTTDFGYDGKGQFRLTSADQIDAAWQGIGGRESVLEAWVDFECELSVVAARSLDGSFAWFGPIENVHSRGILDTSVSPARIGERTAREAVDVARGIMEKLGVVGVLCTELFLARDGRLLVNELAPRPHNSGHFSFDACLTSQFEQQLRAVCGLPLGSTEQFRPAAMANLLGDLWQQGEPDWAGACALPQVKLHLYGKLTPRPGRKMGHVTAVAATPDEALSLALEARRRLSISQPSPSALPPPAWEAPAR